MVFMFTLSVAGSSASAEGSFLIGLWFGLTVLFLGIVAAMIPYRILDLAFRNGRRPDGSWSKERARRERRHFLNFLGQVVLLPLVVLFVIVGVVGVTRDYLELVPGLPSMVNHVDGQEWAETMSAYRDRAALNGQAASENDAVSLGGYFWQQRVRLMLIGGALVFLLPVYFRFFTLLTRAYARDVLKRRGAYLRRFHANRSLHSHRRT